VKQGASAVVQATVQVARFAITFTKGTTDLESATLAHPPLANASQEDSISPETSARWNAFLAPPSLGVRTTSFVTLTGILTDSVKIARKLTTAPRKACPQMENRIAAIFAGNIRLTQTRLPPVTPLGPLQTSQPLIAAKSSTKQTAV